VITFIVFFNLIHILWNFFLTKHVIISIVIIIIITKKTLMIITHKWTKIKMQNFENKQFIMKNLHNTTLMVLMIMKVYKNLIWKYNKLIWMIFWNKHLNYFFFPNCMITMPLIWFFFCDSFPLLSCLPTYRGVIMNYVLISITLTLKIDFFILYT